MEVMKIPFLLIGDALSVLHVNTQRIKSSVILGNKAYHAVTPSRASIVLNQDTFKAEIFK
jgi:hypothetical protein